MRIEFLQKIRDLTEEEEDHRERMAIEPKDKRYKWRRVCLWHDSIYSVYEANEKETIIDYDGELLTVKGNYADVLQLIVEKDSKE
jgi:hypothetical protein